MGVKVQGAVVFLTLCRGAEGCVGFGDGDEALACSWVIGVAVWMVGFR